MKSNGEKATGFGGGCLALRVFSYILLYLSLAFSTSFIKGNITLQREDKAYRIALQQIFMWLQTATLM